MPYVTQERRDEIKLQLSNVTASTWSAGDVVYGITRLVTQWLGTGYKFLHLCLAVGIFVCALLEFYRRVVAPYEDKKKDLNGDVYE